MCTGAKNAEGGGGGCSCYIFESTSSTCIHAKISRLVASLPTTRQQVVFALLVPSCQQVWNKLITTCSNLVDIIRPVSQRPRLYLTAPACLIMPSSVLQIVNSLFQTFSAVASSLIGVAHIHIFVFTNHKNNRFQKKLITQNTNTTLLYLRNCQWLVVSHREVFWTRYFSVFM